MKSLKELRDEKLSILTNAYNNFVSELKKTEKSLFSSVLKILRTFRVNGSRFSKLDEDKKTNKKRLTALGNTIKETINESTYEKKVKDFTSNFDKVEVLAKEIIKQDTGIEDFDVDVSEEKQLYIDEIISGMLNEDSRRSDLDIPLQKILRRAATSGIKIEDAEGEVRVFLQGRNGSGKLVNRARTYARESIQRFNGLIHQKACEKYDLTVFRILNPLIKTSQQVCIDMIEQTGELGRLSVGNRLFLVEDIPEIIKILIRAGHYKEDEITPQNYFILRNHYGCIHDFVCTFRTTEWVEEAKEKRANR